MDRSGDTSAHPALPLDAFLEAPNEVSQPDFDLFRDTLNHHFYPARVDALERHPTMRAPRISAVHLNLTTIGYVRPGTLVSVDPGDLSAYHVNVALGGAVVSRCGDQEVIASPTVATVFSPGHHTSLPRWDADATQLSIKFTLPRVEEELAACSVGPSQTHRLPAGLPRRPWCGSAVDGGAGRAAASVDTPGDQTPQRHLELLERSLITGLLLVPAPFLH